MEDVTKPSAAEASDQYVNSYATGKSLFRTEALSRHSNQWMGATILAVPFSFKWYSLAAFSLNVLIAAFLIFATYSTTESIRGVVLPEAGVTKVSGTKNGIVVSSYVKEGQLVAAGDPIVSIQSAGASAARTTSAPSRTTFSGTALPMDAIKSSAEDGGVTLTVPAPVRMSSDDLETVTAPVAGQIYQLNKALGDNVFSEFEPVASIGAASGQLSVTGYASSTVQSRLQLGTVVHISLDAFKNEPSGQLTGAVIAISNAPSQSTSGVQGQKAEQGYKVLVQIDQSSTQRQRNKLIGMQVEVKIPVERRKIYEWLLDPLKTLFR